jgi:hypothetical protein
MDSHKQKPCDWNQLKLDLFVKKAQKHNQLAPDYPIMVLKYVTGKKL